MRPGADVVAGVDLIRTAKENPPDDWLYWLVWEYGLEELLPYLTDPRDVIADGIQWQRIRGTPGSITMAMGWLGLAATIDEEDPLTAHWYEYQLDPGSIPSRTDLENLVALARLSAPVGTRLSRVYHGYDLRRAVYDRCDWSDGSLYSDHSGVWDDALQADLSFGRTHQAHSELPAPTVGTGFMRLHSADARYNDTLVWDVGSYDDEAITLNGDFQRFVVRQIMGQGVGRNLLVADGTVRADGSQLATGGQRAEIPQFPFSHITGTIDDVDGWGPSVSWGDRTWGESLP